MKKLFSVILCVCLILGILTVGAAAQTNYCELFDNQWGYLTLVNSFGTKEKPWSASDIAFITSYNLKDFDAHYNAEISTEHSECYTFTKEEFEARANQLFDVKVDLTTANYSGLRDVTFDATTQNYVVSKKAAGGASYFHICGYKEVGNEYEVYMQKVDGEYLDEYIKCTATISGGVAKLLACENVSSIPAENELITQNTDFSSSESPVSSDVSSAESDSASSEEASSEESSSENASSAAEVEVLIENKDIKIEAEEGIFPEGVVVKAEIVTDTAKIDSVKNSVKGVAEKFVLFDITAKSGLSSVQPNGKLTVTFAVPDGYNMDKLLVLYVDGEGKVDRLAANVNKTDRTITVELTHLSYYLVAEMAEGESADGTVSEDTTSQEEIPDESAPFPTVRVIAVAVALLVIGGGVCWYLLYYKKKIAVSKHE